MQQFVEETEVNAQELGAALRGSLQSREFIQETHCVDPMAWLGGGSSQEDQYFTQDQLGCVEVSSFLGCSDAGQEGVDGVTLDFLGFVTKFIDDQRDGHLTQLAFNKPGHGLLADIESEGAIVIEIRLRQLCKHLEEVPDNFP